LLNKANQFLFKTDTPDAPIFLKFMNKTGSFR
jgi:hypothetical protein